MREREGRGRQKVIKGGREGGVRKGERNYGRKRGEREGITWL